MLPAFLAIHGEGKSVSQSSALHVSDPNNIHHILEKYGTTTGSRLEHLPPQDINHPKKMSVETYLSAFGLKKGDQKDPLRVGWYFHKTKGQQTGKTKLNAGLALRQRPDLV